MLAVEGLAVDELGPEVGLDGLGSGLDRLDAAPEAPGAVGLTSVGLTSVGLTSGGLASVGVGDDETAGAT